MWVCSVLFDYVTHGRWPIRLLCPWNFPGKSSGVGCHFLLQRIFPTQGWKLHLLYLLYWQVDFLSVYHMGSPYIYGHTNLPWPSLSPGVCSISWIDRFYLLAVIYIIHMYNQHAHTHIPLFSLLFSILFMY